MTEPLRLAVAGVGNNISALFQGVEYYRKLVSEGIGEDELDGVTRPRIGGLGVSDVSFVAAFDLHPGKVNAKFADAVLAPPNNYPRLDVVLPDVDLTVDEGMTEAEAHPESPAFQSVVERLKESGAEVLLYSLPTGLQPLATAYARAALAAEVAFVNCTPESTARSTELLAAFERAGVPLIGDDLASHFGTSVVHRALLGLLSERGLTLSSSYQLNFGGNEDFRNLRVRGGNKRQSKINALTRDGIDTTNVEVIPSAGYIGHLRDHKVAIVNIEARGWAGTPVSLDLKLEVQDSSNAAGVIIDLIRVAAAARRAGAGGFSPAAVPLLKSPAGGHPAYTPQDVSDSLRTLDEVAGDAADR
jgi:myo-inositol-1-phosphate synthase